MLSISDFREKQLLLVKSEWGSRNRLKLHNQNLVFMKDDKVVNRLSVSKIFAVFIVGDVSVTTKLIQYLDEWGVSVYFLKSNLDCYASLLPQAEGNYLLREKQYTMSKEEELDIAKMLVQEKVIQQMENLRSSRLLVGDIRVLKKQSKSDVEKVTDHKSLLGIEGNYSRKYFQIYFKALGWRRRAPRVKEDIPNLLLDIGYTYLFNFVDAVLRVYGFDTYKGVYHKLFFARKSLACDLMEPFRPIIDRKLRAAWNLGQIKEEDFKYWNHRYQLPWQVSNVYSKLFFETIMDEKEEIFLYIRDYYRYVMNPEENDFPVLDKKTS